MPVNVGRSQQELRAAFDAIDTDRNGSIARREFAQDLEQDYAEYQNMHAEGSRAIGQQLKQGARTCSPPRLHDYATPDSLHILVCVCVCRWVRGCVGAWVRVCACVCVCACV